jgi:hypothetical protein
LCIAASDIFVIQGASKNIPEIHEPGFSNQANDSLRLFTGKIKTETKNKGIKK